jgi:hypothetical protein
MIQRPLLDLTRPSRHPLASMLIPTRFTIAANLYSGLDGALTSDMAVRSVKRLLGGGDP